MNNLQISNKIQEKLIGDYLEGSIPSWDNNGLIIGNPLSEPEKIMVALDCSQSVINACIDQNIDLLVTHHPPFIGSIKSITNKKYLDLIKHNIAVISFHLLLDKSHLLVNYLKDIMCFPANPNYIHSYIQAKIKYNSINSFISSLEHGKGFLRQSYTGTKIYANDADVSVVFTWGSPTKETIDLMLDEKPEFLITGELNYHNRLDLTEAGINTIELGHDVSEFFIQDYLYKHVKMNTLGEVISYPKTKLRSHIP